MTSLSAAGKALSSGNQWYFFSKKAQHRTTKNGYWEQLDVEEAIYSSSANKKVGIKKCLVFYMGEAAQGTETNWMMQEYALSNNGLGGTAYKRKSGKKNLVIDHNFSARPQQYCYIIIILMIIYTSFLLPYCLFS